MSLVRQTAPMWLDSAGPPPEQCKSSRAPVLVLARDRDELISVDLAVSLDRAVPNAELAICPTLGHDGPTAGQPREGTITHGRRLAIVHLRSVGARGRGF